MTSQSPRIYTYKITFEEVPYYYYGMHTETKYDEEYWGSPVTNKWCWKLYTPKKQILELFGDRRSAHEVEKRLIKSVYNTDKWCLNASVGGINFLSKKQIIKNAIKGGKRSAELKVGVHARTKEQMIEDGKIAGRIGGKRSKELGLGIHGITKEQMSENGIKGGKRTAELKLGVHARTKEQMIEDARKGGLKTKELGIGVHGRTKEKMSEDGKKSGKIAAKITNFQKWICLETGHISNSGGLSRYQKAKGIDTSKRKRIG
jgi:hypothetical protein